MIDLKENVISICLYFNKILYLILSCYYWHFMFLWQQSNPINKPKLVLPVTRQQQQYKSASKMTSSCS